MDKNLTWKIALIVVLVPSAALALWWFGLNQGLDLKGGTSLIYEIDAEGLKAVEKKGLSTRMITVLKRRIDPANIQNLIWRPHGNTRFEIQMPLASAKARAKRKDYEKALRELLEENTGRAVIIRSIHKPAEERIEDFNDFARGDPNRLEILKSLATAYDERQDLRNKRDALAAKLKSPESEISSAGLDLEQIKLNVGYWTTLNEQELTKSLKDFLGSDDNLGLLTGYVKMYAEWAGVVEQLTNAESGKNIQYKNAGKELDRLNLTEDEINSILVMPAKSGRRSLALEELKSKFSDRKAKIDKVATTFDEYRPFQGRLDDPRDLQRMLKGAGVLEFRILPILGHPEIDNDEMHSYVETLKAKGPKYASTREYVWCEIEDIKEWKLSQSVVGQFGDKWYVLASNKQNEAMLHNSEKREWKLEKAMPSQDEMGRRAIRFRLDERGGKLFFKVTGANIDRPLCILLDGLAISAPNIKSRISRRGTITGMFSETEQEDMVNKLNAGSLPAMLIEPPISVNTIGPSIGADNRDKGIRAGFVGLAVVVLCMLVYYMLAGSIADVALLLNILFILAVMALLKATFTLPGIAGIILTIGMSVDANVLIFERIREEQEKGSSVRIAVRNGYQRAFRTIFDANLTTFITAAILCGVASEEIKGFAIVLMLGIVSSMVTALFVTRVIFDYLLAGRIIKEHLSMLCLIHKPNINWMASRPIFFCISILLIAAGLFVFFTRDNTKNNKYDIEFTGGTAVVINLKDGTDLSRQDVEDKIHEIGRSLNNSALVAANVYSIGKPYGENLYRQYAINTTETNKTSATVTFGESSFQTVDSVTSAIKRAEGKFGGKLNSLVVTEHGSPAGFVITTSQLNKSLVKGVLSAAFPDANVSEPELEEVVNNAIVKAFENELAIQQNLEP